MARFLAGIKAETASSLMSLSEDPRQSIGLSIFASLFFVGLYQNLYKLPHRWVGGTQTREVFALSGLVPC
jgi:hypothetical protein